MAAFLQEISRRQVDGDPLRRQRQAQSIQGAPYAIAALRYRLVGKPDQREGGQARGDLHLDVDRQDFDPAERHRADARYHLCPVPAEPRVEDAIAACTRLVGLSS